MLAEVLFSGVMRAHLTVCLGSALLRAIAKLRYLFPHQERNRQKVNTFCTYCPTKVDKQLGGPFLDFWPIRPIKKINGASPQPPNTHWKPFNLI